MSERKTNLYSFLPRFYRFLDAEQGGHSLRAFFEAMQAGYDQVHDNVLDLYDSPFIETCAPWQIPYIGSLVAAGINETAGRDGPSARTVVANALRHRRRKGRLSTLARSCADASGWAVHAVDASQIIASAQLMSSPRPDHTFVPDVSTPPLVWGPFEDQARVEDPTDANPHLSLTLDSALVFIWRVRAYPIDCVVPHPHPQDPAAAWLDPLGRDQQLMHLPQTASMDEALVAQAHLPVRLTQGLLAQDLRAYTAQHAPDPRTAIPSNSTYYGPDRGLSLTIDGERLSPLDVTAASLFDPEIDDITTAPTPAEPTVDAWPVTSPDVRAWSSQQRPETTPGGALTITLRRQTYTRMVPRVREPRLAGQALASALRDVPVQVIVAGGRLALLAVHRFEDAVPTVHDGPVARALGLSAHRAHPCWAAWTDPTSPLSGDVPLRELQVFDGACATTLSLELPLDNRDQIAASIQSAMRSSKSASARIHQARVLAIDQRFVVLPGPGPDDALPLRFRPTTLDPGTAYRLGLVARVALDVERGRIRLPLGSRQRPMRATLTIGRAMDVGAGPYVRPIPTPDANARPWRGVVGPADGDFPTLDAAIDAWMLADRPGHLSIRDSSTYPPCRAIASAHPLVIVARPDQRPCIAGGLRIESVKGLTPATVLLEGLLIGGDVQVGAGSTASLRHCTVAGSIQVTRNNLLGTDTTVHLYRCLTGPLRARSEAHFDVEDCVIDGQGADRAAIDVTIDLTARTSTVIDPLAHELAIDENDVLIVGPDLADPPLVSLHPMDPGYAQLRIDGPVWRRTQTSGGPGVTHKVRIDLRRQRLLRAIRSQLPVGLRVRVHYVT